MKTFTILFFLLTLLNLSYANDASEEVSKNCIDGVSYKDTQITIYKNNQFDYQIDSQYTRRHDRKFIKRSTNMPFPQLIDGVIKRGKILDSISKKIEKDQLTRNQAFCLIKCSAASVLDYKENDLSTHSNVVCTYSEGRGVCTEFSRVFKDIAQFFGYNVERKEGYRKTPKIGTKNKVGHSFNVVTLNNIQYIVEPQKISCGVYRLHDLL